MRRSGSDAVPRGETGSAALRQDRLAPESGTSLQVAGVARSSDTLGCRCAETHRCALAEMGSAGVSHAAEESSPELASFLRRRSGSYP